VEGERSTAHTPGDPTYTRAHSLRRAIEDLRRRSDNAESFLERRGAAYWIVSLTLILAVSVTVVVPTATAAGGLSPVDELWYADALDKAAHGQLTNTGDSVGSYSRQVKACRGVIGIHGPSASCGAPQPDSSLPLGGLTSADIHAPTYFFAAAGVARAVIALGVTNDLLIAGRLAGVLWLTLGCLAFLAAMRSWGAGRVVPLLTACAIAASPLLVSVSGYVTPDAMGLLVGSVVMIAVGRWLRHELSTVSLALIAAGTAFVKVPFVLAPIFFALLVVARQLAGPAQSWRRAVVGASTLVVSAGAGAVTWQIARGLLGAGAPAVHPDPAPDISVRTFASYLGYYMQTIPVDTGAPIPVDPLLRLAAQSLVWLLIAAALGGLLWLSPGKPLRAVCWAGAAAMIFGSAVLSLIVLVASGGFLIGTPRYGLALLPLWALPLASSRKLLVAFTLFGIVCASLAAHVSSW
jgi:hypothetical protein